MPKSRHTAPKVYNIRHNNSPLVCFRVDRGSRWGNPFLIGEDGDRDEVCDLFEQYAEWRLSVQPDWLEPLRGVSLECWCKPLRCHADTLIRLANQ